jgi:hypothetical protein
MWFCKINSAALGLSSCFILLGTGLLYANSGSTSLDSLYIITSISDINSVDLWYKPYYINLSLVLFTIGFLFKVSAAPFHFWSPDKGLWKSLIVGCKLSNSGKPLELQVPSYIRKGISGWTNHSCMVTSLKASEKNVGNRGSKSVIFESIAVKEQRVYGSLCGGTSSRACAPHIRCTLMGFERSYQVRILSNQIIQRQLYSTISNLDNTISKLPQINEPWFISGFTDAEGCFLVIVLNHQKEKPALVDK